MNVVSRNTGDFGMAESNKKFWIGANDINTEGSFTWIRTGAPLVYNDWRTNQPNNAHGIQDCASISYQHMQWFDDNCNDPHDAFICEKSKLDKCLHGYQNRIAIKMVHTSLG